jgi:colicin import membrane protein
MILIISFKTNSKMEDNNEKQNIPEEVKIDKPAVKKPATRKPAAKKIASQSDIAMAVVENTDPIVEETTAVSSEEIDHLAEMMIALDNKSLKKLKQMSDKIKDKEKKEKAIKEKKKKEKAKADKAKKEKIKKEKAKKEKAKKDKVKKDKKKASAKKSKKK